MFGLSGQGSPLPLLLDDALSLSVIVHSIDETHLGQMHSSVSVAGLAVKLSGSRNLLWGRCWFGLRWFGLPFGLHIVHVCASKCRPCVSGTTLVFAVSPSLDCCWAY